MNPSESFTLGAPGRTSYSKMRLRTYVLVRSAR